MKNPYEKKFKYTLAIFKNVLKVEEKREDSNYYIVNCCGSGCLKLLIQFSIF